MFAENEPVLIARDGITTSSVSSEITETLNVSTSSGSQPTLVLFPGSAIVSVPIPEIDFDNANPLQEQKNTAI